VRAHPAVAPSSTSVARRPLDKRLVGALLGVVLAAGIASGAARPASADPPKYSVVMPTAPIPRGSRVYYVSPKGSDANRGTKRAPWRTIQRALNALGPNRTAVVRAGRYAERTVARVGGRSRARARLLAYPGERPVIAGRLRIMAPHFRVSGVSFQANANDEALVWVDAPDVEVSLNEIHDSLESCVFGGGDRARIVSNWIHDCGTHHVNGSPHDHGIYWTGGNDALIANNVIERAIGFGIQVRPYTSSNARNVIRDNTIIANGRLTGGSQGASGIILDGSVVAHTVVRNNVVAWNTANGVRSLGTIGPGNVVRRNLGWQNPKGDFPTGYYGGGLIYDSNTVAPPFTRAARSFGSRLIRRTTTPNP
jgi:Right handed beta helix region/Protein of unknown function (DUF1565)